MHLIFAPDGPIAVVERQSAFVGAGSLSIHEESIIMRGTSLLLSGLFPVVWARVAQEPAITPAPSLPEIDLSRRQDIDLGSLAPILLTAVPPSILALALTNLPAVSRLLWSEFLDDKTPDWFTALPTDVQGYLSGEFGPTTTAASNRASATSSSSPSSSNTLTSSSQPTASEITSASNESDDDHHGGLPSWAKIVIGVAVPVVVLGIVALVLLCCWRRRLRRRRAARAQSRIRQPPGEQHLPLRGGYISSDTSPDMSQSEHPAYRTSTQTTTTIGGPSYEELPPIAATHRSSRGSKQSLSSLHSVPEVPEPYIGHYQRSQDPSTSSEGMNSRRVSPLNPLYSEYGARLDRSMNARNVGQGIYAGGNSPYNTNASKYVAYSPHRTSNPFSDPSPPQQNSDNAESGGYHGVSDYGPEQVVLGQHGCEGRVHTLCRSGRAA
ncbi:hypothetical protein BU23DRAFT_574264 [Bimuria novae-zelandiae CBS 107.79]|uniref:Uncharacterized protein n=1 Tax=Bimuria novae-zelandiae CBS 107.79 TaxID=1447943 RepID=A0A6A5UYJ6_9PLEO|nr:hypothetical protein BU23DRAFT_574264 [Bimuria novae-zelandiae CBS 107.79]